MSPIRVLHITPSVRLLGARRSLLTLVCQLAGTSFEPTVLVPARGPLTEELDKRKLRWIELKLPPWRKAGSWFSLPGRIGVLREICQQERIDLIHCNEIYPTPHALVASSHGGIASELAARMIQGRGLHPQTLPVVTHMRLSVTPRMVRNYFLGEATRIVAVSEGAASDFDSFSWKQSKVRVVHNGIDYEEFETARKRRALVRHSLDLQDDDFVIGQIGLLMPRKRPQFLVEAIPGILQQVPHARFVFIGEASPGQQDYLLQLKDTVKQLGVEYAVRFLPFQQRVAEYFGALDLNVLLSNDEGFGRVIIEAAAAHVPTIGSNVGGIPELIEDGETGFLLGPRNASDEEFWQEMPRFTELVATLAGNPEYHQTMGENAFEHTRVTFCAERYVKGVAQVFHEALEEFAGGY